MDIASDGNITLDRRAFKALASETRVEILKLLDGTQKTVSDLAREMDMNKATMFQHLEQLVESGLVKKDSESERATTVKSGPNEAPQQGPPKKWVYYRLSFTGKNVLHPERVRISILLSVIGLSCLIIGLLFTLVTTTAPAPGGSLRDTAAPMVIDWQVDDITSSTRDVGVSVGIADNASGKVTGVDPGATVFRWGVGKTASGLDPDILAWTPLPANAGADRVYATVPYPGWASYGNDYLYLSCELHDRAGNSQTYIHTKHIPPANGPDLLVQRGQTTFSKVGSIYDYDIRATTLVINSGDTDAYNVTVALYLDNPDPAGSGRAMVSAQLLQKVLVPVVRSGQSSPVNFSFSSVKITNSTMYVMADPDNTISETGEGNNLQPASVPQELFTNKGKPPAAKGSAPGFEGVLLLSTLAVVAVFMERKKIKKGSRR